MNEPWLPTTLNLNGLHGIIHVGANTGQERGEYAKHNLDVLWIEPLPKYFRKLQKNLSGLPKQRAINYLIGDEDDKSVVMNICDNEGLSSSFMEPADHKVIYPQVHFNGGLNCRTYKLDTALARERIDAKNYDGMVIDVQGAELAVLKGATSILKNIKRLQLESANFPLYKDYPTPEQLGGFLSDQGFAEIGRHVFDQFPQHNGRQCFDIIYARA